MRDPKRDLLRHVLATIAYRGGKTIRGAPTEFGAYNGGGRTPFEILDHIGDLLDWTLRNARGDNDWVVSRPLNWNHSVARFYQTLAALDDYLDSDEPTAVPFETLFQGPIADALTHIGQLAMLRRMSGSPTRGENYLVAQIEIGRVGEDQAKPVHEFE